VPNGDRNYQIKDKTNGKYQKGTTNHSIFDPKMPKITSF
jgi:hypothetical protein